IGGVTVGKVQSVSLAPPDKRVDGQDTTAAVLEIDPEFAPISSDARAILRQKTLLGETYVELTSGSKPGGNPAPVSLGAAGGASDASTQGVHASPEGGTLGIGRTRNEVQIDEIFNALDKQTREAFQRWMANAAQAIHNRGQDFNDALGNLGPFLDDASNILQVLRRQRVALRGLIRNTGTVFSALSQNDGELANAIRSSDETFGALASEQRALAETFRILPIFERESRLTFERLDAFQASADPVVRELIPVAKDISPTLRSVRKLSPNLKALFRHLKPLIRASMKGLPATRDFLAALQPVLDNLDPFLANLNPVINYLLFYKTEIGNFLSSPPAALAGTLSKVPGQPAPRHALRQISYLSSESLSVYPNRPSTNRGNGYLLPNSINSPASAAGGIFPNFDCDNTGAAGNGEIPRSAATQSMAPCWIQPNFPSSFHGSGFGGGHGPQVGPDP